GHPSRSDAVERLSIARSEMTCSHSWVAPLEGVRRDRQAPLRRSFTLAISRRERGRVLCADLACRKRCRVVSPEGDECAGARRGDFDRLWASAIPSQPRQSGNSQPRLSPWTIAL